MALLEFLLPPSLIFLSAYLLNLLYIRVKVHLARQQLKQQYGCEPPPSYRHSDPFFGLDLAIQIAKDGANMKVLEESQNRFIKYGNTYKVMLMGESAITTCEPENFKSLLSLKFSDYKLRDIRKKAFHSLLGKGIFTTDGIEWEHSRAMLRPNFSRNQVADIEMYDKLVEELINAIPIDGSTVDLQDLFFDLTVDSSTEFLFGESANVLSKRNKNVPHQLSFGDSFNLCTARLGKYIRIGLRPLVNTKKFCQAESNVHIFANRYVYKAIEEYRANQANPEKLKDDNRYIFLRELVKQTQDPQQLRSECLNILLAGRDTTASLMTILWNTLSKRPDVWTKLQQEVDQLDGVKPSYERIKSMKYLRFCINEALRLYPIVPSNSRVAVRDTVLPRGGGPSGTSPIFVKKGQPVLFNTYSMHRREDIYGPDAGQFNPDRWEKLRVGWEYLPFSGGPRICLGQQFALMEASYITVRLMQHFRRIESRDPHPWTELLTITCSSAHGAKVALSP